MIITICSVCATNNTRTYVLYFALLCLAWLSFALLCLAWLGFALLCFAWLRFALFCLAWLCLALLCFALLCLAFLGFALLRFALLTLQCFLSCGIWQRKLKQKFKECHCFNMYVMLCFVLLCFDKQSRYHHNDY